MRPSKMRWTRRTGASPLCDPAAAAVAAARSRGRNVKAPRRWKPLEPPKPPDIPFDPKHPEKFMAAQKKVSPAKSHVPATEKLDNGCRVTET